MIPIPPTHTTLEFLQAITALIAALGASTTFWIFLDRKRNKSSKFEKLLLALAHDRIIFLALMYIERGWLSHEEYENIRDVLFPAYEEIGGNGTATRLMKDIDVLPIRPNPILEDKTKPVIKEKRYGFK